MEVGLDSESSWPRRLIEAIDQINEWIGYTVAWLTLAMVVLTFVIVVLRYGFNIGSIAVQESVSYLHAMVFLLGAAYTRRQALVDVAGTLLFLVPSCFFIFWVSLDYVASSWSIFEGSREAGGLPGVFLLKSLIPLTAALLGLQGLAFGGQRLLDWRAAD